MFVQMGNRLLMLATGILLARFIGAEGYGEYSYAFAWVNFLLVLAELGFPILLIREIAVFDSNEDWPHLKGLILRSAQILLGMSGLLIVLAMVMTWMLRGGLSPSQFTTLILGFLLLPLYAYGRAATAILKGLRHVVKGEALLIFVKPFLYLCAISLVLPFFPACRRPESVMVIQLIVGVVTLGFAVFVVYRFLPGGVMTSAASCRTREWLASALPLTLNSAVLILANSTDILLLGIFRPAEDVGVYRVAVQGAALVYFPMSAAIAVLAPQFARFFAQGEKERLQRLVTTSTRLISLITLPSVLLLVLFGGRVAAWVFGPEFARCHSALAILVLSQFFSVVMGAVAYLLYMTGHERDATRGLIVSAVLSVILGMALIPLWGISGAALATFISNGILHIILFRTVKVKIGINSTVFAVLRKRKVD